jgi:hypothetical protein
VRARAGYLTEHDLEQYTADPQVKMVVIWRGVLSDKQLYPQFIPWLRTRFTQKNTGVPGSLVFVRT